jgi:hypothetical protein
MVGEIIGSWLNELSFRINGKTEVVWREGPLVDNAYMQYNFAPNTLLINYLSDEMKGVISPTDSRFRRDLRSYEEGQIDDSEA